MSSKPYAITSYSYTPGCDVYFSSLPDSVEPVAFKFQEYPGNTSRFQPLMKLARENQLDPDRYWIWTDTHDVFFQTDVPKLHDETPILVSSDGKAFKDVGFWADKTPPILMDAEIYNVGTIAMKGHKFKEFLLFMEQRIIEFKNWRKRVNDPLFGPEVTGKNLEVFFNNYADTMIYNLWLRQEDLLFKNPRLFTCLAFDLELGNTKLVDGRYVNRAGEPYAIVHLNGDTRNADSRYSNSKQPSGSSGTTSTTPVSNSVAGPDLHSR